jgi:hypothetical protein
MPQPKTGVGAALEIGKYFYKMYNKAKAAADYINDALGDDPPVHGYEEVATVPQYTPPPVTLVGDMTQAQADALYAFDLATAQSLGLWVAIQITVDRLGGAGEAEAWEYVTLQREALDDFVRQYGQALDAHADAIADLLAVTQDLAVPDYDFAAQDFYDELDRLQNAGFDASETAYYQAFGLSDEQIADVLRNEIARLEEGGFTSTSIYALLHAYQVFFREAADDVFLQYPPTGLARTRPNDAASTSTAAFWKTGPMRASFTVGNPADTEKTVELLVRPVDVPLNWTYRLDNPAPTLGAGETTTVTLTIDPSDIMLEDTMVRLAVEGFVDGEYIGGILFKRVAPSSGVKVFLPLVVRNE